MNARLLLAAVVLFAGCSKPAEQAASAVTDEPRTDVSRTDESWVESVEAWRAKHETDYRRDWVTIAGLHFLEPGEHSLGSSKASLLVLPDGVPASVGTILVADGWVRYEPAAGVKPMVNGSPLSGTAVLKQPGREPDTEVQINDVTFAVHQSGTRLSLRVWDPDGKHVREFAGFSWFPIDPNYRVVAKFIPDDKPRNVPVVNTYGDADVMPSEGVVEFELNGETIRLRPFTTRPKRFYFVFRDGSSGQETYDTARFLYSDLLDDGTTVLDFNQAYTPPCAYNNHPT